MSKEHEIDCLCGICGKESILAVRGEEGLKKFEEACSKFNKSLNSGEPIQWYDN